MKRFINWIKSFFKERSFIPAEKCPYCKEMKLVPTYGPEDEPVWVRFSIGDNPPLGNAFHVTVKICTNCDYLAMTHVL